MIHFSRTAMVTTVALLCFVSSPATAQQPIIQQPIIKTPIPKTTTARSPSTQPPSKERLTVPRVSPRFALISAKGDWLEVHQTSFYSSYTHQTYSVYRTVTRRVIVNGKVQDVTSQVPEMRTRLVQDIKPRVNRMNVPQKGTRFFNREGRLLSPKKIEELLSSGTFPVVIFDSTTAPVRPISGTINRLPPSPSAASAVPPSPKTSKPTTDPNQLFVPPFYRQILAADAIIAVLAPPAP